MNESFLKRSTYDFKFIVKSHCKFRETDKNFSIAILLDRRKMNLNIVRL